MSAQDHIITLDCGHRYYDDDPRLESDNCVKCFDQYHRMIDKL